MLEKAGVSTAAHTTAALEGMPSNQRGENVSSADYNDQWELSRPQPLTAFSTMLRKFIE